VGLIFSSILVGAALAALLLSDVGLIFGIAIVGGLFVGIVKFVLGDRREHPEQLDRNASSNAPKIVRIDSSKIPIGGSAAAGIAILILFTAVLHDVRDLRLMALPGLLAGLAFAAILRVWRKRHPRIISRDWLSIRR